ncbi:MAG: ATP-dependent RecD-like DNA helicase [Clostridia bacterium]|nr:ATP-dependent RecD-like DNA helicase [Clostridia bacterium]
MDKLTISGAAVEIIFHNDENGYTIFDFESDTGELITVVGYTANLAEGEQLTVTGSWVVHPEYGEQFKMEYYKTLLPTEEQDILRYLSSGVVYGVRAATAKKLVMAFGKETLDIMLSSPERLAEIKGISPKRAAKIGESFREIQAMQSIVMFLQQYNVSANLAVKIYKIFGGDAVSEIKKNPYVLTESVDGIKFSVADKIAFGEGIAKNNPLRLRSGMKYLLMQAAYTSGHTYLPKNLMIEHGAYNLDVFETDIENILSELILSHDIYIDKIDGESVYFLSVLHKAECYTASRLYSMSSDKKEELLSLEETAARIDSLENITGMKLAAEQKNAVATAMSCGCMVLTGGPGTGKTTTINTILRLFEEFELKVVLAAPTGRAAKRMNQLTGLEAKTIHRLLGAAGEEGGTRFTYDENNPIQADAIILDEVSMIDISLMYAFLRAVKPGTRLILSGDADQLPSVGPGNVLNDIIKSGVVPVIKLDKIFRQAEQSLIVVNAHSINRGEMPVLSDKSSDFFFLRRTNAEGILSTIVQLCKTRLPSSYGIDPFADIQVLSPSKKGLCGSINLNHRLQAELNPPDITKSEYAYGKTVFRVGDKVMQIKNNYDLYYTREVGDNGTGIFNGDMGKIIDISVIDKLMVVMFDEDKRVEYPFNQLDELVLAYAITVHKSQGSEFPFVIMPAAQFPPMLMCRNLFYTAVTRAKTMVILVGMEQPIEYMTKNDSEKARYTGLCGRLISAKEDNDLFDEVL